MDKVGHPPAHPMLRLKLCPNRNKHQWCPSSVLSLQQPPQTLDARDSLLSPVADKSHIYIPLNGKA